ncbi:hypothetical protein FCM35_KLT06371 [Carex littledalei]|uniref:Uncharacterized protein n=1 Tax=Carex littledalei TaxID=544730 RepID=A0A833VID2_9POAL|nr:hypothetical protein FCM35_KLT06371 [Carex littledalei]
MYVDGSMGVNFYFDNFGIYKKNMIWFVQDAEARLYSSHVGGEGEETIGRGRTGGEWKRKTLEGGGEGGEEGAEKVFGIVDAEEKKGKEVRGGGEGEETIGRGRTGGERKRKILEGGGEGGE